MGKRSHVVILSSDDEDEKPSNRSYSKPKSRLPVTRTNPRAAKKARASDSQSQSRKRSCNADGASLFWEGVDEEFTCLEVSAGARKTNAKELWVDKYKPCSLEELAVQKKKVEEVKVWFEERLRTPKEGVSKHVLVITGQAGIGKSTTIHIIASLRGAQLCEWNTPTPTIWQEHMHNSNSGIRYTSKLDDFENFVEKVRKYGLIQTSFIGESKSPLLLLIDDLPLTNAKVAYGRLRNCLDLLVQSVQIPTVILVTDYGKCDPVDDTMPSSDKLVLFLESAGACKVAFNPITTNAIKKVLSRICRQENCNVSNEQIDLIAKASGGDIRNAITSLQFFCLKPDPTSTMSLWDTRGSENQLDPSDNLISLPFGKDETLSLFHALGKFLHNKREPTKAIEFDQNALVIQEKYTRLPMKMDAPEKVLSQAHGQARPIAEFLHENCKLESAKLVYLLYELFYRCQNGSSLAEGYNSLAVMDFLNEEAIDDAWMVVSYLGDADLLLASSHGMLARNNEAENILQLTAASVAARGVLFGNSQPVSSRWHAIRRPKLWQVEQSCLHYKHEMARQRLVTCDRENSLDVSVIATEYTPLSRWLGCRASGDFETHQMEDDNVDRKSLSMNEREFSDDEIEDWEDQ